MGINEFVKELTKREGKKRQVDIAQMREIVGCMCDIIVENEDGELLAEILKNGIKRSKKK